jgi:hypothetical protein
VSGPEDNPADEHQPTKEEWEKAMTQSDDQRAGAGGGVLVCPHCGQPPVFVGSATSWWSENHQCPVRKTYRDSSELVTAWNARASDKREGEVEVERVARVIYWSVQRQCPTKMDAFDDAEQREFYMNVARDTVAALSQPKPAPRRTHDDDHVFRQAYGLDDPKPAIADDELAVEHAEFLFATYAFEDDANLTRDAQELKQRLRAAARLDKPAGEAGGWEDADARSPEREGRYIITYAEGGRRRVFIGDFIPGEGWSGLAGSTRVVAWMEAPEPFKKPTPPPEPKTGEGA